MTKTNTATSTSILWGRTQLKGSPFPTSTTSPSLQLMMVALGVRGDGQVRQQLAR
uniref:Uncharacterized protein n=1 Tax=Octopus bimaculoides TaxID=37653 RepID=A0A0L8FI02_OCTBM